MCPNKTLCKFRNTDWSESFFWRSTLKKLFRYSIEISDRRLGLGSKKIKIKKKVFYLSTQIKGKFRTKKKINDFSKTD